MHTSVPDLVMPAIEYSERNKKPKARKMRAFYIRIFLIVNCYFRIQIDFAGIVRTPSFKVISSPSIVR